MKTWWELLLQVGLTAAFTEVELLPSSVAEQIPAESNPALLRQVACWGALSAVARPGGQGVPRCL